MPEPKEPDGKKPPPECKAILMCDQIIVDAMTGKSSLIGLFDRFTLIKFPVQLPPFWVFLQLVDGIGRYGLLVEIHDLREDKIIARLEIPVEFPERTNRANVQFVVAGLPLSHSGVYDLVVFADGKEINRQRLEALQAGDENNATDQPNTSDDDGK